MPTKKLSYLHLILLFFIVLVIILLVIQLLKYSENYDDNLHYNVPCYPNCANYKNLDKNVCKYDTGQGCNTCTTGDRGVEGCKLMCNMAPCNALTEASTTIF